MNANKKYFSIQDFTNLCKFFHHQLVLQGIDNDKSLTYWCIYCLQNMADLGYCIHLYLKGTMTKEYIVFNSVQMNTKGKYTEL